MFSNNFHKHSKPARQVEAMLGAVPPSLDLEHLDLWLVIKSLPVITQVQLIKSPIELAGVGTERQRRQVISAIHRAKIDEMNLKRNLQPTTFCPPR